MPCSSGQHARAPRSGRWCRSRSCTPSRRARRCCSSMWSATQPTSTPRGHRVDGRPAHLDAEEVAPPCRTPGGAVSGLIRLGSSDAALLAGVLPVGEDGVQDAAGAAGRDQADGLVSGHRRGVEQVERHGDDLALELGLARAHVALQGVDMSEQSERLVEEAVVIVVAAVHGARALAGLPDASSSLAIVGSSASTVSRGRPCSGRTRLTGNRSA